MTLRVAWKSRHLPFPQNCTEMVCWSAGATASRNISSASLGHFRNGSALGECSAPFSGSAWRVLQTRLRWAKSAFSLWPEWRRAWPTTGPEKRPQRGRGAGEVGPPPRRAEPLGRIFFYKQCCQRWILQCFEFWVRGIANFIFFLSFVIMYLD